jgi:hypothetical protein
LSQAYIKELDRLQTLDITTKDDFHKGKWKPRKNMCATVSSINKTSLNWGGARSAQRALILQRPYIQDKKPSFLQAKFENCYRK